MQQQQFQMQQQMLALQEQQSQFMQKLQESQKPQPKEEELDEVQQYLKQSVEKFINPYMEQFQGYQSAQEQAIKEATHRQEMARIDAEANTAVDVFLESLAPEDRPGMQKVAKELVLMASSVFGDAPGESVKTLQRAFEKYRTSVNRTKKAAVGKKLAQSKAAPKQVKSNPSTSPDGIQQGS